MTILHGKVGNERESEPKLYRVRNRRYGACFQLREVPLKKSSLCGQGSYILDAVNVPTPPPSSSSSSSSANGKKSAKKKMWTWFGPRADLEERRFAATTASNYKRIYADMGVVKKEEDILVIEMKQTAPYVTFKDQPEFYELLAGVEVNIDNDMSDEEKEDEENDKSPSQQHRSGEVGQVGSLAWSKGCFGEGRCKSASDLRAPWDGLEEMTEEDQLRRVKLTKPLLYVLRTNDGSQVKYIFRHIDCFFAIIKKVKK
jgi:hypothetical protein